MTDLTQNLPLPDKAFYKAVTGYFDDNIDNLGVHDNKYSTIIERGLKTREKDYIGYKGGLYLLELNDSGKLKIVKRK